MKSRKTFNLTRQNQKKFFGYQFVGLTIIFPLTIFFASLTIVHKVFLTDNLSEIWFSCLNFFTQQTNILIIVCLTLHTFFPKNKIFNKNYFIIAAFSYITVTCFIFNLILVPIGLVNMKHFENDDLNVFWLVSTFMLHVTTPLYAFGYFFLCLKNNILRIENIPNKKKTITYLMIYPIIYCSYVFACPFIFNRAVYTQYSNCNPNLIIDGQPGRPIYFLILLSALIIILLSIVFYTFLTKNKINKYKSIYSNSYCSFIYKQDK